MKKSTPRHTPKKPAVRPVQASRKPDATSAVSTRSATSFPTKVLFGLFLLSLFTPLVYSSSTYFGYISERSWYLNGLIELMFLVAIWTPAFFSGKLTRLQGAVLLFLTVLLVADLVGVDPVQSFFSSYSRLEGFLLYLHLGLYFFALVRVPFPRSYWHTALLLSTVVAGLVVISGYFSKTGWQAVDHRLIATVGNPSFLAVYLLLHSFLTVYLFFQFPGLYRPLKGTLAGVTLVVLVGGLLLTGTRSALIGLAAGSLYLAAFGLWRRYPTASGRLSWFGLALALLAGLFWLARTMPFLQKVPIVYRLTNYSGVNNTLSPRFICWKMGLSGLAERPWLGWGQDTFSYGFARHYDPAILLSSDYSWYDRAHNVLIDLGFSAGVLGLLAYGFLWFCLIRKLLTTQPGWLSGLDRGLLGAIFVAYFVFNLFNFDSLLPLQLIFLLLAFIDQSPQPEQQPIRTNRGWLLASRLLAVGLIALLSLYSVLQPYRTLRALDRQNSITDISARTQALETIYERATGHQLDMADNLVSLTLSVLGSNYPKETKQLCYRRAIALMNEQLLQHPAHTRVMARLASLYVAGGEVDKAIRLYQHINTVEGSKRPPAFIQLGNAYLNKGDMPQALAAFEQAHRLYPRWEEPALYKALAFAVQGDTTRCYALLRSISTPTLANRLAFVKQIYGRAGNPHGFVTRLAQTERKEFYPPVVFAEWALAAFDANDTTQMTTAINSYYNMYLRNRYPYADLKQLIDDGKHGIRPDRLSYITSQLTL